MPHVAGMTLYFSDLYCYLFGEGAKAKIIIRPAIFGNSFLKGFELVFAPMLVTYIFIEYDHSAGNDAWGQKVEHGLGGAVNVTIHIDEAHWALVALQEYW